MDEVDRLEQKKAAKKNRQLMANGWKSNRPSPLCNLLPLFRRVKCRTKEHSLLMTWKEDADMHVQIVCAN